MRINFCEVQRCKAGVHSLRINLFNASGCDMASGVRGKLATRRGDATYDVNCPDSVIVRFNSLLVARKQCLCNKSA